MATENTSKRKKAAAAVAVALAAAIGLTGTFAWTSISQRTTNVKVVDVNPGGRLHDDYDGTNKYIYAENFTDPEDSDSAPVFVRVRLLEYMETGDDAGTKTTTGDGTTEGTTSDSTEGTSTAAEGETTGRNATSLMSGAQIDDITTWSVHIPGSDSESDPFHDYWSWTLGGSTVYMPTFNKNKDSLAADVNGTYEGATAGDATHFDDYHEYTSGAKLDGAAYYDADDNDVDEGETGEEGTNYTVANETHIAVETHTARVITMEQWKAMDCPIGDYWVWDADGWAYWAEPLQPGEATGCLLSKVTNRGTVGEKCYYGIYVQAQFASAGDWGTASDEANDIKATGFYEDGITTDALALLNKIIEIQN